MKTGCKHKRTKVPCKGCGRAIRVVPQNMLHLCSECKREHGLQLYKMHRAKLAGKPVVVREDRCRQTLEELAGDTPCCGNCRTWEVKIGQPWPVWGTCTNRRSHRHDRTTAIVFVCERHIMQICPTREGELSKANDQLADLQAGRVVFTRVPGTSDL